MKTYIYIFIAGAAACALVLLYDCRTTHKRIDCGVAEFHPDYTTEMRKQCQLVRSGRLL